MAILTPIRKPGSASRRGAAGVRDSASDFLAHPLADALLVIVPALLLLGLGTLMVWSASTVYSYARWGDAYYFMKRQVAFVAVGLGVAYIASRVSPERLRKLGWLRSRQP